MVELTLYGVDGSPPVRAVKLTLAALNLPYKYVQVNILGREQLSPAFLEKNPQHTVPTLEDGGNFIWDSHAIMAYLVTKYASSDELYPKDPLKRAVVDQRLHFESGVVFAAALRSITKLVLFLNQTVIAQTQIDAIVEAYDFVEKFLQNHDYIAGNSLTIADFSLVSSITSLVAYLDIDQAKYTKLSSWIKKLEKLPYYEEANGKGAAFFVSMIKGKPFTVAK
ncbi:uncharacterized protein Dwil_GK22991 [Drosophila willistoni]|uniref:Glutathione transferase n=1 Tax=Drosophila willistoni TaxID=7260 RepID=B4NMZ5_DROWI|nr:glutathione S-transferase 1 [Drosophila willistoni]EDW85734.1 uncharacterized protein Dwil_GK22991 [Drosophila willistoni]